MIVSNETQTLFLLGKCLMSDPPHNTNLNPSWPLFAFESMQDYIIGVMILTIRESDTDSFMLQEY